jgi:hypothetical protein
MQVVIIPASDFCTLLGLFILVSFLYLYPAVLRIRDILVRIRIRGYTYTSVVHSEWFNPDSTFQAVPVPDPNL